MSVYTFSRHPLLLLPASLYLMNCFAQTTVPTIKAKGVVTASAFGGSLNVAPGSWIEIYGANLATQTRSWAGSDFNGVNAPTALSGTSVTIAGQPTFIDYISPGQVNVQVPSTAGAGQQSLVVTTAAGSSSAYALTVQQTQPGILSPPSFNVGGKQYVAAVFSDGVTYALPSNAVPGVQSRVPHSGDVLTIYGVGFGATNPNIPAGQVVQQSNTLAVPVRIAVGNAPAAITYQGLAQNLIGLFNLTSWCLM